MVLSAIARIENTIGQQVFQSTIRTADFTQFTADDPAENTENVYDGWNPRTGYPVDGDGKGDSYIKLKDRDGVNGALIFSFGTNGRYSGRCEESVANVDTQPYPDALSMPSYIVDGEGYITNENWNWVNLGRYDNGNGVAGEVCHSVNNVTEDMIVHEIAHALGLAEHFSGFGIDGVWTSYPAAILKSLYNNPTNTLYTILSVD